MELCPSLSTALRKPNEDDDTWLERVEQLLTHNRDHRLAAPQSEQHDAEIKELTADRHVYAMWWDFYAVTEALKKSDRPGTMPEMVFGGPDTAGTVWVKIYRVIDPSQSFCPDADCGVRTAHCPLPVLKVLEDVVWYHESLDKMLAFDVAYDYRRPSKDDPSAPKPIPSIRDRMGLV